MYMRAIIGTTSSANFEILEIPPMTIIPTKTARTSPVITGVIPKPFLSESEIEFDWTMFPTSPKAIMMKIEKSTAKTFPNFLFFKPCVR